MGNQYPQGTRWYLVEFDPLASATEGSLINVTAGQARGRRRSLQ